MPPASRLERKVNEHSAMQFGIMSVSDITQDPTTGHTPSERERIKATATIAIGRWPRSTIAT